MAGSKEVPNTDKTLGFRVQGLRVSGLRSHQVRLASMLTALTQMAMSSDMHFSELELYRDDRK